MTRIGHISSLVAAGILASSSSAVNAAELPEAKPPQPTARVLIIGGESGDPQGAYARNMRDWSSRFVTLMSKERVPAANMIVLGETARSNTVPPVAESTLANVRAAFDKLGSDLHPEDQFVLFMVGHGTVTEPVGKLCLPGPDLNANELAKLVDQLPTRNVIIINCASGSAEFLDKYARQGRVVVSASGIKGGGIETVFAEFFLFAYECGKADENKDGKTSVLEAFNWAAGECLEWYGRQGKISPEDSKETIFAVAGKESCRIFQKLYEGTDLKYDASRSRSNDPDGPPIPDEFGHKSNRMPTEMASIEDRGEPPKAAVVEVRNERVRVAGLPGEEGEVAVRTFLGHPSR